MNYFFLYLVIAQNKDIEQWINILFIVVLAVFWVLRGVIKAKVDEAQRQKQKPRPIDKARSPSPATKLWSESLLEKVLGPAGSSSQPRRRPKIQNSTSKTESSRMARHKLISKSKPDISIPYQIHKKKKAFKLFPARSSYGPDFQDLRKIDTKLQELPEFTTKAIESISDIPLEKPSDVQYTQYLSELVWDYKNPDELRKAILHYEILGKPLSLRDLSESF
jgi:hypothetical protein